MTGIEEYVARPCCVTCLMYNSIKDSQHIANASTCHAEALVPA